MDKSKLKAIKEIRGKMIDKLTCIRIIMDKNPEDRLNQETELLERMFHDLTKLANSLDHK